MLMTETGIDFVCSKEKIVKNIWGIKVGVSCVSKNPDFNCKDYEERD